MNPKIKQLRKRLKGLQRQPLFRQDKDQIALVKKQILTIEMNKRYNKLAGVFLEAEKIRATFSNQ